MADRRLRVGVIGPGFIARRHLEILAAEADVELVGIVASTPARAEAATARWGGRPCTDVGQLLETGHLDAAWVCLPPDRHGPIEERLLQAGVHLFIEKPLAADESTPESIADTVRASGLVAAVGYHWRAIDALAEVRDVIASDPVRLVAGTWYDTTPGTAWWRRQASSGGQFVEQATHLVDLSRLLVGEASVIASTADRFVRPAHPDLDVASVSAALLRYEAGPTGVFSATCILGGPSAIEMRLLCEDLAITISQRGVRYEDGGTEAGGGRAVSAGGGGGGARGQGDASSGAGGRFVPVGSDPLLVEDRAFLRAIRTGDPSAVFSTYDDALRTHRLTTAIRAAAEAAAG